MEQEAVVEVFGGKPRCVSSMPYIHNVHPISDVNGGLPKTDSRGTQHAENPTQVSVQVPLHRQGYCSSTGVLAQAEHKIWFRS